MAKPAAIMVTPEEAMLIDYITTLHSYDYSYLELLRTLFFTNLRMKVFNIISENVEAIVLFDEPEVEYLLITIPITFRFLKDNCGYTLKVKLFKSQVSRPAFLFESKPKETTDGTNTNNNNIPPDYNASPNNPEG